MNFLQGYARHRPDYTHYVTADYTHYATADYTHYATTTCLGQAR